jgi:hypothetical protein
MTSTVGRGFAPQLLDFDDDTVAAQSFQDREWTDGRPVVLPTEALVSQMLDTVDDGPDVEIGSFPPHWRPTYVHHVAVNAVMAGCRPDYFPVVLASIKAALQKRFNLYGVQATTNPCGVTVIANGPAVGELGINNAANLFGQGNRANATIGRAVRLCMINIGGGLPVSGDMSTLGDPSKYGMCFAENEAESPWEPYHVEKGFAATNSVATVASAVSPQNLITMTESPSGVIDCVAKAIITSGSNCQYFEQEPVIVFGPTQAHRIARGGYTKQDVRELLWERGRKTLDGLDGTDEKAIRDWRAPSIKVDNGVDYLYPTPDPSGIHIVVAGGQGPHSAILPTFNGSHVTSELVSRR